MKPQKFVCWMVRRLVGPSVCNNVLKKQGSYTSMVLTEHLLLITNVIFNCYYPSLRSKSLPETFLMSSGRGGEPGYRGPSCQVLDYIFISYLLPRVTWLFITIFIFYSFLFISLATSLFPSCVLSLSLSLSIHISFSFSFLSLFLLQSVYLYILYPSPFFYHSILKYLFYGAWLTYVIKL